jgi:hypothetical protein
MIGPKPDISYIDNYNAETSLCLHWGFENVLQLCLGALLLCTEP